MDRLALINSAIVNCGVSGGAITTSAGLVGSQSRIAGWVDDAWNELQTEHDDWDWMRSSNLLGSGASFVPTAGQYTVPLGTAAGEVGIAIDDFTKWDKPTFRCYTTAVVPTANDEQFLNEIRFDTWRDSYMLGAMRQVQTRPVAVAIGPNQSVNLGPPSNGLYTITADYWVGPSIMSADTSVPAGLPLRYHMLIVYMVMKKYALYESAPEVLSRADREFTPLWDKLEYARLPQIGFGGGLGS